MSVIRFHDVSKSFPRHRGHMLLREHLGAFLRSGSRERFYALKHVSLAVDRGESLAVIGHNGAGKSTLLGLVDLRVFFRSMPVSEFCFCPARYARFLKKEA